MAEGSLRGLGFFYTPPISPGQCSWMSETLSISAALRENRARQEDCLWLSAEKGELVCPSVLFPAALG